MTPTPKAKPWIEEATERCETYAKIERMSREERKIAKLDYDEWYLPEAMLSIQQTAALTDLPKALELLKRLAPILKELSERVPDRMYYYTHDIEALLQEIES